VLIGEPNEFVERRQLAAKAAFEFRFRNRGPRRRAERGFNLLEQRDRVATGALIIRAYCLKQVSEIGRDASLRVASRRAAHRIPMDSDRSVKRLYRRQEALLQVD
jgi:hypothetical protein